MKRVLLIVLALIMIVGLVGCGPKVNYQSPRQTEDIDYFSYLDISDIESTGQNC